MFVKIIEYFKVNNNLRFPHRGKVVSNEDEKNLGRIKCRIKGLIEEENEELLPWVYPQTPFGLGGRPDSSWFTVPEVDSEVEIVFPYGDVYHPVYRGFWQSELTHSLLWQDGDDYPNSYGFLDKLIEWFRINKGENPYIEFFRMLNEDESVKNNLFRIDEEGSLWINIPKNVTVNVEDGVEIQIKGGDEEEKTPIKILTECPFQFQANNIQVRSEEDLEFLNGGRLAFDCQGEEFDLRIASQGIHVESGELSANFNKLITREIHCSLVNTDDVDITNNLIVGNEINTDKFQAQDGVITKLDINQTAGYGWQSPHGACSLIPGLAANTDSPDSPDSPTSVGSVSIDIVLDRIADLEAKLDELNELAKNIKEDTEEKLPDIAKVE